MFAKGGNGVCWPTMFPNGWSTRFAFFCCLKSYFFALLAPSTLGTNLSLSLLNKSRDYLFLQLGKLFLSPSPPFLCIPNSPYEKNKERARERLKKRKDTKKVKKRARKKVPWFANTKQTPSSHGKRGGTITISERNKKSEAKLWQFQFFYPLSLVSCVCLSPPVMKKQGKGFLALFYDLSPSRGVTSPHSLLKNARRQTRHNESTWA